MIGNVTYFGVMEVEFPGPQQDHAQMIFLARHFRAKHCFTGSLEEVVHTWYDWPELYKRRIPQIRQTNIYTLMNISEVRKGKVTLGFKSPLTERLWEGDKYLYEDKLKLVSWKSS